jgi:fructose/tagatose bisphosphate aldolase
LEWYGALARAAAESARVPCAAMFNECAVDAAVERATQAGFNVVMLADEQAAYADLVRRVAGVVSLAHARAVAVEAELGILPSGKGSAEHAASSLTDPDQAAQFVALSGADLLAVSAGNVHIMLRGQCDLDLAHLAAIRKKVEVPLVLHGGSGISNRSLTEAIGLGVAKVNYGTYLKQRCIERVLRQWCGGAVAANPHEALGGGSEADLMVIVRQAVRDAVLERIELLGCCGKA